MLSARSAMKFSDAFGSIDSLLSARRLRLITEHQGSKAGLGLITANIHDCVKNGMSSAISTYHLDRHTRSVLLSHGYQISEEIEDDIRYYVISWEDAGENRS